MYVYSVVDPGGRTVASGLSWPDATSEARLRARREGTPFYVVGPTEVHVAVAGFRVLAIGRPIRG